MTGVHGDLGNSLPNRAGLFHDGFIFRNSRVIGFDFFHAQKDAVVDFGFIRDNPRGFPEQPPPALVGFVNFTGRIRAEFFLPAVFEL